MSCCGETVPNTYLLVNYFQYSPWLRFHNDLNMKFHQFL